MARLLCQHFLDIICVCLLRTVCLKAVKGRWDVLPFLGIRQTITEWICLMHAVKILKDRSELNIIPAHLSLCFSALLWRQKKFCWRHWSDSYLSPCLLNSLSLLPIWERYTSTVISTGKKHLSTLWNRHSAKKTVNILKLILSLFSLKI